MDKDFVRTNLARWHARRHAAEVLLDLAQHADAFDDAELSAAERAEAYAELRRIVGRLMPEDA